MASGTEYLEGRRVVMYLDGNISSGKSTATTNICDALGGRATSLLEVAHKDGVLEVYLENPKKLSGMFQVHMLQECRYRDALSTEPGATDVVVVDRSITGNAVFALLNYALAGAMASSSSGSEDKWGHKCADDQPIGDVEYGFYKTLYEQAMRTSAGGIRGAFEHGTLNVYLHTSAHHCVERCKRRSVEAEQASYDVGYFQAVERAGMVAILANLSREHPHPQIILDWCDTQGKMENFHCIVGGFLLYLDEYQKFDRLVHLSRTPLEMVEFPHKYRMLLDFSEATSAFEFFSAARVAFLFNALCHRGEYDADRKPIYIAVPPDMPARPWNGTFELTITD